MTPKCTSIAATPPCPKDQQQTNHNCSYYCGLWCPDQHDHHCHNCYCHCCYGNFGWHRRIAALSYNDTRVIIYSEVCKHLKTNKHKNVSTHSSTCGKVCEENNGWLGYVMEHEGTTIDLEEKKAYVSTNRW